MNKKFIGNPQEEVCDFKVEVSTVPEAGSFNPLALRNDQGLLWENYLAIERMKFQEYTIINSENYFWRTHTRQEIDWVEEQNEKLTGYEFKWNSNKKAKIPALWKKGYPNANFELINQENYLDFIS